MTETEGAKPNVFSLNYCQFLQTKDCTELFPLHHFHKNFKLSLLFVSIQVIKMPGDSNTIHRLVLGILHLTWFHCGTGVV